MGMAQWTKQPIQPGSLFHTVYNIKPGDYLMMYDSYASEFLIKEPSQGKIVFRKRLDSPLDLAMLVSTHLNISEIIAPEIAAKLKRGGKSLGGGELVDHHIIPVHLWKDSQLVKQAIDLRVIDMNGRENRMLLSKDVHKKSHDENSKYSQIVRYHLRDQWNDLVDADLENDPSEIRAVLIALIEALREDLQDIESRGGSLNDIW